MNSSFSKMSIDIDNMCRTCASSGSTLMQIYGTDGQYKHLADKINRHLPISVLENDLLPTKICSRCIFSLEASIEFHSICEKADKTLKDLLVEQHTDILTEMPPDSSFASEDPLDSRDGDDDRRIMEKDDVQWVKTEPKLPYCEPCNILFTNPKDLIIHNQENHQSQPTLTIPPPLRPIDTVFYNEVEITKKFRPIAKKSPITKVIPKVAKTITKSPVATKPRQAFTVIRPLAPKAENPSEIPLVIKRSIPQKTALEQIMTSQPLRNFPKLPNKRLKIPCIPIQNLEGDQAPLQELASSRKPIEIPPYECKTEDAMDVEVFIPDTPLFDLGNVEENLPIHVNITDDPGFVCDRCNSTFRSKALLRDHIIRKYIITNPDDFEHPCDECGKKFPTSYSLKAHIRNKKARQTKIGCIICNKNVTRKEWPNHFAMHNNADKFNCNICDKRFGNNWQLKQHSSVHANLKYECDLCSVTFNRKSNLILHRKIHLASAELVDNLRCDICNYHSNDRYYMMHHHKVHYCTDQNAYVCPVVTCEFMSDNFQALREHCMVHSRGELNLYTKKRKRAHRVGKNQIPPYLCSLCKSEFVRPVEYSSHISQDHGVELMAGEAIFTCNHCFETYGSLLDLNEHLEKHPEAHKYPCSKCSMTFAVFNARNHHLVTVHSTKFECEICNMSFLSVFKLKEHMPAHSDIKPFTCKTCGKGFKRKRTLGEHQKVHSDVKKFICEHCNVRFRWKGDLVRHATRHTGINLYHCSECEYSSNKRKEVEAHIADNHSVIVDMQV